MEDITRLTVHELVEKLNKNELSSEEIVKAYKARIEDKENWNKGQPMHEWSKNNMCI